MIAHVCFVCGSQHPATNCPDIGILPLNERDKDRVKEAISAKLRKVRKRQLHDEKTENVDDVKQENVVDFTLHRIDHSDSFRDDLRHNESLHSLAVRYRVNLIWQRYSHLQHSSNERKIFFSECKSFLHHSSFNCNSLRFMPQIP